MSTTMHAAVLHAFGSIPDVEDVPVPEPGPGEVRLAVRACGVDRFDVDICAGKRSWAEVPLIPGHEIAGEVAAVGPGVEGWAPWDRVVPSLYLVCGDCRSCRAGRETICRDFRGHIGLDVPGGYAQQVVVPARNLVALPDHISFEQGALAANVVGTAWHGLAVRMGLQQGERVIVTGAGGGVGLHAIQIARHLGAEVMAVDRVPAKLAAAAELGAAVTVAGAGIRDAAMEWTDGEGVDAVLELVGPATMVETLPSLAKGGRMVVVGSHSGKDFTVDPHVFYRHEWEIRGSRNVSVAELETAVGLIAGGAVSPVVDRSFGLEDVAAAFERMETGAVVGRDVLLP